MQKSGIHNFHTIEVESSESVNNTHKYIILF